MMPSEPSGERRPNAGTSAAVPQVPAASSPDVPDATNRDSQEEPSADPSQAVLSSPEPESAPAPKAKRKRKRKMGTARGIETMFRTSYRVHVDLTALADNKANIMISINGLIIPIMLFAIVPLFNFNEWLLLPSSVLVITCLVSIVYAVLSARPRINPNPVTRTSIQQNQANILFFGNFAHLSEREFVHGMSAMVQNPDSIYYSMMRDIYGMGRVLSKKFALLKHAYSVFMVGLIISIMLYLGVFMAMAFDFV